MAVIIGKSDVEDFFNDVTRGKFTSSRDEKFINFLYNLLEDDEHEIGYNDFKEVVHVYRADYDHNYTDTEILHVNKMN